MSKKDEFSFYYHLGHTKMALEVAAWAIAQIKRLRQKRVEWEKLLSQRPEPDVVRLRAINEEYDCYVNIYQELFDLLQDEATRSHDAQRHILDKQKATGNEYVVNIETSLSVSLQNAEELNKIIDTEEKVIKKKSLFDRFRKVVDKNKEQNSKRPTWCVVVARSTPSFSALGLGFESR